MWWSMAVLAMVLATSSGLSTRRLLPFDLNRKVWDQIGSKDYMTSFLHSVLASNSNSRSLSSFSSPFSSYYSSLSDVESFLGEFDVQLRHRKHILSLAEWTFETNMTDETSRQLALEQSRFSKWLHGEVTKSRRFKDKLMPATLSRQIGILSVSVNPGNETVAREISQLQSNLITIYNSAKACGSFPSPLPRCMTLEPDLVKIMANSRDPNVLKEAWIKWRDVTGLPLKSTYQRLIGWMNRGARNDGFTDYAEYEIQQGFYNTPDLEELETRLWKEVQPLYKQLHAYIRRKLTDFYGRGVVGDDGSIPAHLLGDMWSQDWLAIYDIVVPYPEVDFYDDVGAVLSSRDDVTWMFRLASDFYQSMGLPAMTSQFWNQSMKSKPSDRLVDCHSKTYDMFDSNDFRIKMCTRPTFHDLLAIFHEMGHVTYCMAYANQPTVYRSGANLATHEAVGDMMQLSILSHRPLKAMGLIPASGEVLGDSGGGEKKNIVRQDSKSGNTNWRRHIQLDVPDFVTDDDTSNLEIHEKRELNRLMFLALHKLSFLPFGYLVDRWRYGVMRGQIKPPDYNKQWWKMRLQYQGIQPPTPRSEYHFDPGSKHHIVANEMFSGYFISQFQQFQMYSSLCKEASSEIQQQQAKQKLQPQQYQQQEQQAQPQQPQSQQPQPQQPSQPTNQHKGPLDGTHPHSKMYHHLNIPSLPLHQCDLYGSKKAGNKLRRFLSAGSSQPWQQQLLQLTGDVTVTSDDLLTYFRPLHRWLTRNNDWHGEKIGWEGVRLNWSE